MYLRLSRNWRKPSKYCVQGNKRRNQVRILLFELSQFVGAFYSEVPEVIFESHWFLVESNEKKITIDWEHDEYRWMKPEELEGLNLVPWIQNMITTLM